VENNRWDILRYLIEIKKGKKYTGPVLLANELICYRLAKVLNLNVAKIELMKIQGKQGIISIVKLHINTRGSISTSLPCVEKTF
jgi:hypothetical protein